MELNGIRPSSELVGMANGRDPVAELGKTQFLELMIAQINNQDPLDPAKNEEFVAQLAQFSSLEGIQNLNESVSSMASSFGASLTLQAASLVGRSVLVPVSQVYMNGEGLGGNILNGQPGSEIVVEITDSSGALVTRLPLGPQESGNVRFIWDAVDQAGEVREPGVYGVRAYALTEEGATELDVELPELVVSVSLQNGLAEVNLAGGTSVPLSAVKEIQ